MVGNDGYLLGGGGYFLGGGGWRWVVARFVIAMRLHVIFAKSCSGVSFGHILHVVLVFNLLTLKM